MQINLCGCKYLVLLFLFKKKGKNQFWSEAIFPSHFFSFFFLSSLFFSFLFFSAFLLSSFSSATPITTQHRRLHPFQLLSSSASSSSPSVPHKNSSSSSGRRSFGLAVFRRRLRLFPVAGESLKLEH